MPDPNPTRASGASLPSRLIAGLRAKLPGDWWKWVLVVIAALAAGFFAGRAAVISSGAVEAVSGRVKLRPGPWGEVEYLPITIAAPRKLLRVQAVEDESVEWYFPGLSRADVMEMLTRLGIPGRARAGLTSASVLSVHPQGVKLMPSCEDVRALGESGRLGIYEVLSRFSTENGPNKWEFLASYLGTLGKFGVSRASARALEEVSARHGRHVVTYAMPCVLSAISSQDEKVGMMKALSQQPSMLVRLKVSPRSDVQALGAYWGRGLWGTDVEAILESLRMRPDGGAVNILELLPPLPASLLHSYPVPHNFLKGPEEIKNCSWTALNFFRDEPRPEYADQQEMIRTLAEEYLPVFSDPRYGDVAIFLTPDREIRHAAVYLADDLYFTKNGDNPWHPWVYSTAADMIESFSFGLGEGQTLSIHYFRGKNL